MAKSDLQALCSSSKAAEIIDDTSGVLFLGTPHQGSPLSIFGFIIAWATSCLGSSTGLLFTLQHHSSQLSDLDLRFDDVRKNLKDAKIYSIPETKPSYILGCISLGLVSLTFSIYHHLLLILQGCQSKLSQGACG